MNFIKKNKFYLLLIALLIVLIFVILEITNVFNSSTSKAAYGNRLTGEDKVKITTSEQKKVISSLKSDAIVKNATYSLSGRTVEIIITVKDDASTDNAKALSSKVLEVFSTKQKKYYDFQIFIKKDTDATDFPIIGYRHYTNDSFTWTKNR
jgi:hypothetical protein